MWEIVLAGDSRTTPEKALSVLTGNIKRSESDTTLYVTPPSSPIRPLECLAGIEERGPILADSASESSDSCSQTSFEDSPRKQKGERLQGVSKSKGIFGLTRSISNQFLAAGTDIVLSAGQAAVRYSLNVERKTWHLQLIFHCNNKVDPI